MFFGKRINALILSSVFVIQILTSTLFNLSKVEAAISSVEYEVLQFANEESKEEVRKGDIDKNGEVNSIDYFFMRIHLLGEMNSFPNLEDTWRADVNGDGIFDSIDFGLMRSYMLGNIDKFPAETDNSMPTPSSSVATPTPADTEPPSKPIGLNYSSITGTMVLIYWEPSADSDIKDYAVYKNGEFEALTNGETNYTFTNLIPNEIYEFRVCAIDAADNRSEFSDACIVNTKVSTEDEIKLALIHNFSKKGTNYSLTYVGDMEDIQTKVNQALEDAVNESNEPFILYDASYDMSGYLGNLQISFTFTYDDENEYMLVARSIDELEEALLKSFYDRTEKINIVYKNSITNTDLVTAINSVFSKDTYSYYCISGFSYRILSIMGINAIECSFDYKTTKEQEAYVDRTVEFIVSKLTNADMSEDEKEKLIHDFILTYVDYYEEEEYGNAYSALYYGKTKCDGYSMLAYKMLKAADIESIIVRNEDHAWNLVKINGKWYHLDVTWDDAEKKDYGFYKYYNLSDDEILDTRNYNDVFGIDCTTNYIAELSERKDYSDGKYEEILKEVSKKDEYCFVNSFNSNASLSLMYNEVILKEGESISLVDENIPSELYANLYQWSTSDPDIATVTEGVITAKKTGTIIVAAQPVNDGLSDTSLFCRVHIIPVY